MEDNREKWIQYFRSLGLLHIDGTRIGVSNYLSNILFHVEYLIRTISFRPKKLLEIGCGSASHSCFISYFGIECVALDNNKSIVKQAYVNVKSFLGRNVEFVVADAFYLPFKSKVFDICICEGFLEHFDKNDVESLLTEQMGVSEKIVFSVPSNFYPKKGLGDECLFTASYWVEIILNYLAKARLRTTKMKVLARYYRLDLKFLKNFLLSRDSFGPYFILVSISEQ